jgi:hypothetical protein
MRKLFALLSAGLFFLFGCAGAPTGPPPRTASMASRIAFQQNSIEGYHKFLRQNPFDPYASGAKKRLAKLLLEENDRTALEEFVRLFPKDRQLVQSRLDEFSLVDKVMERMNDHEALKKDNSRLSICRGEPYYAYLYNKNYVGFVDPDMEDLEFSVKIERIIAPDCIKISLLSESHAFAERFNSLTNIYYKVNVSSSCSLGEYPVKVLFGVYRTISGENEKRMGGSSAKHVVIVKDTNIKDPQEVEVLSKSISYYGKKIPKLREKLSKLLNPGHSDFAAFYLYSWELSRYKIELEKFSLFQSIAQYYLKEAQQSSDDAIKQAASDALENPEKNPYEIQEFTPFN